MPFTTLKNVRDRLVTFERSRADSLRMMHTAIVKIADSERAAAKVMVADLWTLFEKAPVTKPTTPAPVVAPVHKDDDYFDHA